MLVHLLRRLGQSVLVLLAVSFISFMVFRHIGDPTISLLGEDATLQEREALVEELGFNKPVPLQYLSYVGKVLHGDLGISYRLKRPVAEVIAERLPATLELALTASVLALLVGIVLGVYTAIRKDGWLSRTIMTVSLVGVAAHVSDWHWPDLCVCRRVALAAVLRAGADRQYWRLGNRLSHGVGLGGVDPACHHAGLLQHDADHAAGACRDAGSAALGLHPLWPCARPA